MVCTGCGSTVFRDPGSCEYSLYNSSVCLRGGGAGETTLNLRSASSGDCATVLGSSLSTSRPVLCVAFFQAFFILLARSDVCKGGCVGGAEEYEHELADDIQSPPRRLPGTTANSPDKVSEVAPTLLYVPRLRVGRCDSPLILPLISDPYLMLTDLLCFLRLYPIPSIYT